MVGRITSLAISNRTLGRISAPRNAVARACRGGVEKDDAVTSLFCGGPNHPHAAVFTADGRVYKMKDVALALCGRSARGKAIVNILPDQMGVLICCL